MAGNDTAALGGGHLLTSEIRPRMAKADLRKPEIDCWKEHIGRALERARTLAQLTLKELADAIGRDERQVARWIAGTERPQLDAIFAVPALRGPLVIALAELSGTVEVTTTLTVRKVG